MSSHKRYLFRHIEEDLDQKMVWVTGPRQCGKTTLMQNILETFSEFEYFNWDDLEHKAAIRKRDWNDSSKIIGFDEIHKWTDWKSFLKGTYDSQKSKHKFIVTGSARLDVYRKGADSLLGRYHMWRLHPLSLSEARSFGASPESWLKPLLQIGGFPEPFLKGEETFARRWRRERYQKIIQEDVRDFSPVQNIQKLELLVSLLRRRAGSEIVMQNLADDLLAAPKTVKQWFETICSCYIVFPVFPYSKSLSRAVQKPPKAYFFDTGDVIGDEGARFENLVACELLKRYQYLSDRDGYDYQLHYIRDREQREVDFLVTKDDDPHLLIECKLTSDRSTHLRYFSSKLSCESRVKIVREPKTNYTKDGIWVVSATQYFSDLEEPKP